ncbi:MAG: tetratricopeptide repeat protein [Acidimicrobiia bacterium]|nr:tetratricopeptide repeat protein [Acidimicrobiia bacterium]
MSTDRSLEQIEFLNEELADIDRQLEAGDIDQSTADRLRARYVAELDAAIARRDRDLDMHGNEVLLTRMSTRTLIGVGIVGIAVLLIAAFAVSQLRDGGASGVEGVAGDALSQEGRDLSTVSNEELEAVVAENPDVVPMRLALARRYFEAGDFDKALDHYFEVLDREQHPEALANVGWMTYLSGHPDVAVGYVEAALERDPTYLTARWFLGNIYVTLGRGDEAIVMLTSVVNADETPDDIRETAVALIRQVEEGS